jgi:hypothetical protein
MKPFLLTYLSFNGHCKIKLNGTWITQNNGIFTFIRES